MLVYGFKKMQAIGMLLRRSVCVEFKLEDVIIGAVAHSGRLRGSSTFSGALKHAELSLKLEAEGPKVTFCQGAQNL